MYTKTQFHFMQTNVIACIMRLSKCLEILGQLTLVEEMEALTMTLMNQNGNSPPLGITKLGNSQPLYLAEEVKAIKKGERKTGK